MRAAHLVYGCQCADPTGHLRTLATTHRLTQLIQSSHIFPLLFLQTSGGNHFTQQKKPLKTLLEFKTFIEESNEIFWTLSNVGSFPANKCSLSGQANIRNVLKEGVATNGGWTWLINEGTLPASKPELRLLNCYKNEMHCDKRFFWRFVEEYRLDSQPTNQTHSSIGSSCMLLRCKHKWQLTKSWVLLLGLASALIPYQLYSLLNRKMIYWFPGSLKTHDPTSPRLKADQWKELLHLLKSALDSGKRTISKSVFALLCLGQKFWHPGIYQTQSARVAEPPSWPDACALWRNLVEVVGNLNV